MVHAQSVDAITNGFMSPTPPKQPGKPSYSSIRDTHSLLTVNAASIESFRSGGQNRHLGIVLTMTQHTLVSLEPLIRLNYPSCTPQIPEGTTPFDEKALLRKHSEHC